MNGKAIGILGTALAVAVLVLALTDSGTGAVAVVGVLAALAMFVAAGQMRGQRDA